MINRVGSCLLIFLGTLLLSAPSKAQDMPAPPPHPGGDGVYGVTSFDVPPAKIGQAVALLKAYRGAALRQAGNEGVLLLQQIGWPSRFVIYDSWKDQSAYSANQASAQTLRLCAGVTAISNSTCDRRDYYQVTTGPHRRAEGRNTVYMVLHLDVFPSKLDNFFVSTRQVAEKARKGRGNLFYDVESGVRTPWNYMVLIGAWRDRAAFDEYETSPYAREFRERVAEVLGSPYDDRLYTRIK